MIIESIKTVLKVFRVNKLRTFLTMLGIIIGIFSVTIIFSLSNSVKDFMTDEISLMDAEAIALNIFGDTDIEDELMESTLNEYLENNKNIKKVSKTKMFSYSELDNIIESNLTENEYIDTYYLGIDENYFEVFPRALNEEEIISGRLLTRKDIISKMPYIVLREDSAKLIFGHSNVVGKTITINNNELKIIGVSKYKEDMMESSLPNILASYYYVEDYLTSFSGKTYNILPTSNEKKEIIEKEIKMRLNEYVSKDMYEIYSYDIDSIIEGVESMVGMVELVFIGIASLSIVVGGIGIMNIMLVSVSERVKETGIRMALGAKNRDIVIQFLIESIMLTILSGIIGIIIAFIATSGINFAISEYTEYAFKLIIDMEIMFKIIIFCGILGIIFGIYPAKKAGRLDPVEALKYE